MYNLQVSLLIALLDSYEGSLASDTHQEYLEVAGELRRKPTMMIQLALKEHDRQVEEPDERVLADDQQTLSDALEDIVDVPGKSRSTLRPISQTGVHNGSTTMSNGSSMISIDFRKNRPATVFYRIRGK